MSDGGRARRAGFEIGLVDHQRQGCGGIHRRRIEGENRPGRRAAKTEVDQTVRGAEHVATVGVAARTEQGVETVTQNRKGLMLMRRNAQGRLERSQGALPEKERLDALLSKLRGIVEKSAGGEERRGQR